MDHAKPLRLLHWSKSVQTRASTRVLLIVFAAASLALTSCNRTSQESGVYPVTYHASSLPDVVLIDQYGRPVAVASLRGKPVLFDFIYTSCPGPCQLLTQHMKLIADKLGPDLGPKVLFVSVTVDPDRDRPTRLLDYARALNANVRGWYFLTGSSAQIDELMQAFRLERSRDNDGEINHVLGYFLVGPDGREIVDYSQGVDPSKPARDAEGAATGNAWISRLSADLRRL
jgi:cytochrome oxidase Cu insertion factor (SCO1/SenC/PrrC family)